MIWDNEGFHNILSLELLIITSSYWASRFLQVLRTVLLIVPNLMSLLSHTLTCVLNWDSMTNTIIGHDDLQRIWFYCLSLLGILVCNHFGLFYLTFMLILLYLDYPFTWIFPWNLTVIEKKQFFQQLSRHLGLGLWCWINFELYPSGQFYWWRKLERKPPTCLQCCIEYTSPWAVFDCICSYTCNYHTNTTVTSPVTFRNVNSLILLPNVSSCWVFSWQSHSQIVYDCVKWRDYNNKQPWLYFDKKKLNKL